MEQLSSRDSLWDDSQLIQKFKNDNLEKAWKEEFSRDHLNYDVVSLGVAFFVNLASYRKVDPSFEGWVKFRADVYVISAFAIQFIVIWIIHRHTNSYHKNRGNIIVANGILRIVTYYGLVATCPAIFTTLLPLQFDTTSIISITRQLAFIPLLLARVTTSFLIPLKSAKYLFLAAIPLIISFNIGRCTEEVTQVAAQGDLYKNIAVAVEFFFSKWIPLPQLTVCGGAVHAAQLSHVGACAAVRNTTLIVVSYFLPMLLFYTEEVNSRKKFERERGLGTAFSHKPLTQFILHALLLPFQAAVTFHTIVYITLLSQEWL